MFHYWPRANNLMISYKISHPAQTLLTSTLPAVQAALQFLQNLTISYQMKRPFSYTEPSSASSMLYLGASPRSWSTDIMSRYSLSVTFRYSIATNPCPYLERPPGYLFHVKYIMSVRVAILSNPLAALHGRGSLFYSCRLPASGTPI